MALFAKRLPVTFAPKQHLISSVRIDVIHNSCRCQFSILFAIYAKGILCQKPLTRLLPPTAVAALMRTVPAIGMQLKVKFAIIIGCQMWAPRMLARVFRFSRHNSILLLCISLRERMKDAYGQRKRTWGRTQTLYAFLAIIIIAQTK